MRILFLGDVVGKVGREAVHLSLPRLINKYNADFVIVNGENATHGKGLIEKHYKELISYGADCVTLGNHWYSKKQIDGYIDEAESLVRPLNLIHYSHGLGSILFDLDGLPVRVTNILCQSFMQEEVISPYEAMNKLLLDNPEPCIHFVDIHGESTSEKQIFAYNFDGLLTAVVGTHTHVQTNDCRILEGGTAFMADAGMCGDPNGVIGFERESVINKIIYGKTGIFQIDDNAKMMVNGCIIDIDEETFLATKIFPINQMVERQRKYEKSYL